MDSGRIRRTVKRIACQVAEKVKDQRICLVGLNERGLALAREIYEQLATLGLKDMGIYNLRVDQAAGDAEEIKNDEDIDHSFILLVDDVMFSGRTMFSAMKQLIGEDSANVYTAVLIDRGHRSLPIHSSFSGMEIPTKPNEHVEMTVQNERADHVYLYKRQED